MPEKYILNSRGQRLHLVENTFARCDTLFLLCHGFTGSSDSHVIASLRHVLSDSNLDNVSIDFADNLNLSEGDFADHTISREIEDLHDVYRHYRHQYKQVVLIGHSMGCTVASQFSLRQPINGLILVAPPYNMAEVMIRFAEGNVEEAIAQWRTQGTISIYKDTHDRYYPLRFHFYEDALRLPYEQVKKIQAPTLIIYSEEDQVVPPEQSKKLFQQIGTPIKEIVSIPGADHSFTAQEHTIRLQETVMRWVERQKNL